MIRQKELALEGLRGIACLGVFFAHFAFSFLPSTYLFLRPGLSIRQFYPFESILRLPCVMVFYNGSFQVAIFFVLSGYVLTKAFFETGDVALLRSGALKRYPRLALPSLFGVLLAYILLKAHLMFNQMAPVIGTAGWPIVDYKHEVPLLFAIKQGLIGAPLLSRNGLDEVLWTMPIELIGSLLLFAAYGLFGRERILPGALFFGVMAVLIFPSSINQIDCFMIYTGSLLHRFDGTLKRGRWRSVGLIALGMLGGAYDYSPWFSWLHIALPALPAPLFSPAQAIRDMFNDAGALALVAGVTCSMRARYVLSLRPFAYLGKISFSLYLVHWPIICSFSYAMMYFLKVQYHVSYLSALAVTFVLTIPLVLGIAYLFELVIDQPAIWLARRLARRMSVHGDEPVYGVSAK